MKNFLIVEKNLYIKALTFIAVLSAVPSSNAVGNSTYVGADAMYSASTFQQDFGGNVISKKLIPGLNLFFGHMFNEHFGAEIGVDVYKRMKNTVTVETGSVLLGEMITTEPGAPANWISTKTSFSQRHPYAGIIAKANATNNNSVSLLAGVSLSHIKINYSAFDDQAHDLLNDEVVRNFSKTKIIPIIRATVEHKFNDKFGVRASLAWKNTSAFKLKSKENPSVGALIKAKDTFTFGIGATYYIF